MHADGLSNAGQLEKIRASSGDKGYRAYFRGMCRKSKRDAAHMLDDERITFPSLYLLLPQLDEFDLYPHLNDRNWTATGIVEQITRRKDIGRPVDFLTAKQNLVHSTLRWMLETGKEERHLGDDYNRVMDIAVSVLINTYKDISVLPMVDELIFRRHKLGQNIHDLVWAFFCADHPGSLELMAKHLRSPDKGECELACKVLGVEDNEQQGYDNFLGWIRENRENIRFTGDSFQLSSNPIVYKIPVHKPPIPRREEPQ